jgi:hypothetical protein
VRREPPITHIIELLRGLSQMKIRVKGLTSLLMACLFVIASFSGVILYLTPQGRVANWTNWSILGLDKHEWGAVHINTCFLMLVVAILHWVWNWKVFWSYIKRRTGELNLKREMLAAVIISAGVVAGAIVQVPPFSTVMAWNDQIKAYWANQQPAGPAPHAEDFGVGRFSQMVGLTTEEVTQALKQAGYEVENSEMTISELADQKGVAPSDVFRAIESHSPKPLRMGGGNGRGPGMGQGRGMGRGMGGGMGRGMGGGMGMGRGRMGAEHAPHDADSVPVGHGPGTEDAAAGPSQADQETE